MATAKLHYRKLKPVVKLLMEGSKTFKEIMNEEELDQALMTIKTMDSTTRALVKEYARTKKVYVEIMDTGIVFYIRRLGKTIYSVQLRAAGSYYGDSVFITKDNITMYNTPKGEQIPVMDSPIAPSVGAQMELHLNH